MMAEMVHEKLCSYPQQVTALMRMWYESRAKFDGWKRGQKNGTPVKSSETSVVRAFQRLEFVGNYELFSISGAEMNLKFSAVKISARMHTCRGFQTPEFPTLLGSRMNGNQIDSDRILAKHQSFPPCWEAE